MKLNFMPGLKLKSILLKQVFGKLIPRFIITPQLAATRPLAQVVNRFAAILPMVPYKNPLAEPKTVPPTHPVTVPSPGKATVPPAHPA